MKVATQYGEQEIEEVIRCYNLWKTLMKKTNDTKYALNQTVEGKAHNRLNASLYYERNRETILAKRKEAYEARKNTPQFLD